MKQLGPWKEHVCSYQILHYLLTPVKLLLRMDNNIRSGIKDRVVQVHAVCHLLVIKIHASQDGSYPKVYKQ